MNAVEFHAVRPADRQYIESYQPGGFRISGVRYDGSVIVLPDRCVVWGASSMAEVTPDGLAPVCNAQPPVDVLLLGCGARMLPLSRTVRDALRSAGIGVDVMDTGAACRTYNVLAGEDRRVAAALIAL